MPNQSAEIKFSKERQSLTVEKGVNLMRALLGAGIPVASSCGGDGVCAKCRVRVLEGKANLTPETDIEALRRHSHDLEKNERLSCQADVQGSVTIDTSYW